MKKIDILKYLAILLLAFLIQCQPTRKTTVEEKLYMKTDYIFKGEVVQVHESNLPAVKKSENTYVVKVSKVLKASDGHENFEGSEITVVIDSEKHGFVKAGENHIFFTKTWLFGETLAVIANQIDLVDREDEIKKEIIYYQEKFKQDLLNKRLAKTELVIVGKVVEVRDFKNHEAKISEHAPIWKTALIEIEEVVKGDSSQTVLVHFSASNDVHWYNSPKLEIGKRGIFLLNRKDEYEGLKNVFILIDKRDFLHDSELENVKNILNPSK